MKVVWPMPASGRGRALLTLSVAIVACTGSRLTMRDLPIPHPGAVAFVGVNVVSMDSQVVLANQTILVDSGRIVAMGAPADVALPVDAQRIDGRGKYLVPGLTDMHVHLADDDARIEDELMLYLANGVTTVRNMDGRSRHLRWRDAIARGTEIGPRIYSCGPLVFGRTSPLGRMAEAPDAPAWLRFFSRTRSTRSAESVAAEHQRAGYDCLKIYSGPDWDEAAYTAAVRVADSLHFPVTGHFARNLSLDRNLLGRTSVDHLEEFNYTYFFRVTKPNDWGVRDSLIPGVASKVDKSGVAITTTLWYMHHLLLLGMPDSSSAITGNPNSQYIPASRRAELLSGHGYWTSSTPRQTANTASMVSFLRHLLLSFATTGSKVMAGTDASSRSLVVPGFSLHQELSEMVLAGLTPYQAIRAATRVPHIVLGDDGGIVRTGRPADLLLIDGNPLDDVRRLAHPLGVLAAGRWWTRAELQDSLNAVSLRSAKR